MHRFCSSLNCGVIFSGWLDTCLNPSFELGKEVHMQLDWHMQKPCITFTCKFLWMCSVVRSCVLKSSTVKCWSIPLIDPWLTLNWPSISTWSTSRLILDQHLNWYSRDLDSTQSTSQLTVNWQSVDSWPSVDQLICIDWHRWHVYKNYLTLNQLLTGMLIMCWSSVKWGVDGASIKGRLRVNQGSIKAIDPEYRSTLDHGCL